MLMPLILVKLTLYVTEKCQKTKNSLFHFSRSSLSALESAEELMSLYRRQSSAERCLLDLTQDGRSMIYTRNSSGP